MTERWIIPLWLAATIGCQQVPPPPEPPPQVAFIGPPPIAPPGMTIITETETIEPLWTGPEVPQAAPYFPPQMALPQHVYPVSPTPIYGPYAPLQQVPVGSGAPLATAPPPGTVAPPGAAGAPQPVAPQAVAPQPAAPPALQNPIHVPVANDEFAWEQIADVTSDYFRIARERRARRGLGMTSDGFIETAPQGGATILEPQRRDSVGEFNRWESTLQTIRRRAIIRVTPDAAGYLVGVEVLKELEDLPRPEQSTVGSATLRFDQSLPPRETYNVSRTRESILWIALGRDVALEQQMLEEIRARLAAPPLAAR